jgi:hypothetical protein
MKNVILATSIFIAIISGLLLIQKNRQTTEAREQAARAETERQLIISRQAEQDQKSTRLKSQLHQTLTEAAEKTVEALELRQRLARLEEQGKTGARPADILFSDPGMKEALQAQAQEACEKQVKSLFRFGLAQQLGLNEVQTGSLADLLMRRISLLSDQIYVPMITGNVDDATMATSGRATKAAYDENTAQLKALLGDEGFNTYERFEKTQSERENLQRFHSECAKLGQDLGPDQEAKLLAAITEERLNFKPQYDIGDPSKWDFEHWYDNFSDDKLVACGNEMGQLNDRMVQRAQEVLSPEQAALFKQLLTRQLNQAKFVVRSTTALFGRRQ